MRGIGNFAEGNAAVATQEIERGVGGDPGKPVCGFLLILQLILTLESFDESLLREVLRVVYIADDAINLEKNATEMLGNESFFEFGGAAPAGAVGPGNSSVHQTRWRDRLHPLLK